MIGVGFFVCFYSDEVRALEDVVLLKPWPGGGWKNQKKNELQIFN